MNRSISLCAASGDTLSTLACKLQSAGCSVVRGVLDLLMLPSGYQRLLGWLASHLLSIAGQFGNTALDLIPAHPTASTAFLAVIACAALAPLLPTAANSAIWMPARMVGMR